jgi:hypothetical protein
MYHHDILSLSLSDLVAIDNPDSSGRHLHHAAGRGRIRNWEGLWGACVFGRRNFNSLSFSVSLLISSDLSVFVEEAEQVNDRDKLILHNLTRLWNIWTG